MKKNADHVIGMFRRKLYEAGESAVSWSVLIMDCSLSVIHFSADKGRDKGSGTCVPVVRV